MSRWHGRKEKKEQVLPLEEVARTEVVIGPLAKHLFLGYDSKLPGHLSIGNAISDVADSSEALLKLRRDLHDGDSLSGRCSVSVHESGGPNVAILIEENASSYQVLMAHLHATYLRMALGGLLEEADRDKEIAIHAAKKFVQEHGSCYLQALERAKWNTNDLFLEENGGRIRVSL